MPHRRFHPPLLLVILLSLFSIPATYQPAQAITAVAQPAQRSAATTNSIGLVGSYGGALKSLAANGTWLYAEHSGGVAVFDVSDPNQPVRRGHVLLPHAPEIAAYADGIVYVVTRMYLYAIDVTNPDLPAIRAAYGLSTTGVHVTTYDLQIAGNYLYLLYDDNNNDAIRDQLQIFDVNNPDQLSPLGMHGETVWPDGGSIEIIGAFVYINRGINGLTIVNATDPRHPTLHRYTGEFGRLGGMEHAGDQLYTGDFDGRLQIFDVSDPGLPVRLDIYTPTGFTIQNFKLQGDKIYVSTAAYPNPYDLYILDVSDLEHITVLGSYPIGLYPVRQLLVADNLVYLNSNDYSWDNAIQIVDVSNPAIPASRGRIRSPYTAEGVQVVGTNAYIPARQDGLVIFDVSDPTKPRLRSIFGPADDFTPAVYDVQVVDNLAYLAAGTVFKIVDVSNPDNPTLRAELTRQAFQLHIAGNRAYIIGSNEFSILNISDPSNPTVIVTRDLNSSYYPGSDIQAVGNRLFVSGGMCSEGCKGGVEIFDISDETNPVVIGAVIRPFGDVEIVGNLLYIMGDRFLYIYDITNPASPSIRHAWPLPNGAEEVEIVGQYAYIVGGYLGGLQIVDLSVPTQPKLRATFTTSVAWFGIRRTAGVQVVGDLAYVADAYNGLYIFRVDPAQFPSSIFAPIVGKTL
ncbi:MAG: hypothetical protein JOZ51_01785 [Chloroflexi bacterium]|nr:hypothetical protein [Chloroflexota bacterium]